MTSNFAELNPGAQPLGAVSAFVNEFIDAVAPTHLFDDFTRQETAQLSQYLECFGLPRQSVVMREGEPEDFLAILVTGRAVILKGAGENRRVVSVVQPGEMVGELSLFDARIRTASCVTTEPSDFGVLTIDGLKSMLAEHPRLGNKFLIMLLRNNATRIRESIDSLPDEQLKPYL